MKEIKINGLENLDQKSGMIIATNHLFWGDLWRIAYYFNEKHIFKNKPYILSLYIFKLLNRALTKYVNPIYLKRNYLDYENLRLCIKLLKQGAIIIMSPEGKHNYKKLLPAKKGVAFLAQEAKVPIVPVSIYKIHEKNRMFKKTLVMNINKPIISNDTSTDLKQLTEKVMQEIAQHLPEEQRGFYK